MSGTLADLNQSDKRRVARLVEQLLAVEKAHEASKAGWRETQRALEGRATAAEGARDALVGAGVARDLAAARAEAARRDGEAETQKAARDAAVAETTDLRNRAKGAEASLRDLSKDLEASRRELAAARAKADSLDRDKRERDAEAGDLRAENALVTQKLLSALALLENYQEEMMKMGAKRVVVRSRKPLSSRTPPATPPRR